MLEENVLGSMSIKKIAAACGVSCGCFNKLFRQYSGQSPLQYRIELKMNMAKNMLSDSSVPICDVSEALGFTNCAYFCRFFKKKTGHDAERVQTEQILIFHNCRLLSHCYA